MTAQVVARRRHRSASDRVLRARSLRLLVVMGLLAAILATSATSSARHAEPPRPLAWLAAGDSYSAGFGLAGVRSMERCETAADA